MRDVRLRLQSIGARLVFFALLCAVPVIAFTVLEVRADLAEIERAALDNANLALARLQAHTTQQLSAAEAAGQLVSALGSFKPDVLARCDAAMRRARDASPSARNFYIADAGLRIRCSSSELAKGLVLDDQPTVIEAMRSRRAALGESGPGILDARPALILAVPMLGAQDEAAGVTVTVFDAPAFTTGIAINDRLVIGLLDRHGALVSRSIDSPQIELGDQAGAQGELERLRAAGAQPVRLAWLDDRERLYVSREITYRDRPVFWGAAGVDARALERQALEHLAIEAGLVLLVAVAVVLLAVAATRPLVLERMRALLTASGQVRGGHYGSRVRIEVVDEVSVVEKAFNQMLEAVEADRARLDRTRLEIEQLNRELEQRVDERTRELAIANEELESFSSSVSHDLRAPVAVVRAFSQILLERQVLEGKDLHYLERVRAAGENMAELIAALLDLARFGRARPEPKPVDLSQLARDVALECRDATGRELEVHVQPSGNAVGDPGLLRVVMSNLLANAWKFTRDAPAPKVEIGFQADGGECVVTVRDNGAGFDETYASRLFQPFQRLHGTHEFPGLGIGLATVYRIVIRHGGRIWASGRVGGGAAFHFTLPLCDKGRQHSP